MVTYTGRVSVGGPPDVRELPHLTITKAAVDAQMSNNAYLLGCRHTGEQVLIDAAAEPEVLLPLIGDAGLTTVVTTHQHWDHHRALADVVAATGAVTACGADDSEGMPVGPDRLLRHGDTVAFGEISLDVLHLRGHTPGSVALAYADPEDAVHLFTGDSLFPGGVGNTKNPGQSFDALIADVSERVFDVYPDDTWVYPGHGADTTLGAERPHLQEWVDRGW